MPSHNPHLLTRPDRVDPAVCFAVVGGWVFRPLLSQIVMARFRLIYRVLPGFVLGPGACAAHVARWPSRCDGLWLPLGYSGPGSGLVGWRGYPGPTDFDRSEEHTSELQSLRHI